MSNRQRGIHYFLFFLQIIAASTIAAQNNVKINGKLENETLKYASIEFMGYDIKLFQLWSNIVKNGLEAMSEQKEKYLGIFAEKTGTQLRVVFENNGPKIPKEIAESIFQKFYTTKGTKSGSGLGLSIVKNVLKEHNADIILESDEVRTKFIITFDL